MADMAPQMISMQLKQEALVAKGFDPPAGCNGQTIAGVDRSSGCKGTSLSVLLAYHQCLERLQIVYSSGSQLANAGILGLPLKASRAWLITFHPIV